MNVENNINTGLHYFLNLLFCLPLIIIDHMIGASRPDKDVVDGINTSSKYYLRG